MLKHVRCMEKTLDVKPTTLNKDLLILSYFVCMLCSGTPCSKESRDQSDELLVFRLVKDVMIQASDLRNRL